MSSPFPGMDPYLEGDYWTEFHTRLANQISTQLLPQLRPKYVALLEKRYVLYRPFLGIFDHEPRSIRPDVGIAQKQVRETAVAYQIPPVTTAPTMETRSLFDETYPVTSVVIRDVSEQRLVAIIEILSPANKVGEGRRDYMQRREEILQTPTHLIELDLLRRGGRIPLEEMPPLAPYYAYLSRREKRPQTQVWAIQLADTLPVLPVPLLPPDEDVTLDLQTAVDACFALVGYETLLDYQNPPPSPPLSSEEAAWSDKQLQAAGLR